MSLERKKSLLIFRTYLICIILQLFLYAINLTKSILNGVYFLLKKRHGAIWNEMWHIPEASALKRTNELIDKCQNNYQAHIKNMFSGHMRKELDHDNLQTLKKKVQSVEDKRQVF